MYWAANVPPMNTTIKPIQAMLEAKIDVTMSFAIPVPMSTVSIPIRARTAAATWA